MLAHELTKRGLNVQCEVKIPLEYDGVEFDVAFYADIIVDDKVILELKSAEKFANVHYKQLTTYLRLTGYKLGILLNFGQPLMRDGIKRIVNHLMD